MLRALFSVAKTFVVVKTVDYVIDAFTKKRTPVRARTAAASTRKPASKSKPHGALRRAAAKGA